MDVEFVTFPARADRSAYIAKRFAPYLTGKVLDVGCDMAVLKGLLPGASYTGIDIGGKPDIQLNLEQVERLPFGDGEFDGVVCSDVLEHLDNLHHVFSELLRVCRGHLVISLPNNWANARLPLARGRGSFGFYGLPPDKPRDRHKWFFSLAEATAFMRTQAERHSLVLHECFANEKPRPALVRWWRRLRYPRQESYLNRYSHTMWAVLKKP
jgi:2-polyprenyl-3-methyl-5-hydroxy-6-metoxy-1,4-benzoquinol methylase